MILSTKYKNLCREGGIYMPCKWTIPDLELSDIGLTQAGICKSRMMLKNGEVSECRGYEQTSHEKLVRINCGSKN